MMNSEYAMRFLKPAGSTAPTEKPARLVREELGEKLESLRKKKNSDDGNPVIERDINKELPHGKFKGHDDHEGR